jgi:hypothetical protein
VIVPVSLRIMPLPVSDALSGPAGYQFVMTLLASSMEKIIMIVSQNWVHSYQKCSYSWSERSGVIWLEAGISKVRGIRRRFERGRRSLLLGQADARRILLKCSDRKSGEKNLCRQVVECEHESSL